VLRYKQLYDLPGLNYQFILHAHSHFAFAGWMFFAIALLITHAIIGDQHRYGFNLVFIAGLVSAYGMLISFSLQGYKPVSIAFSTLFILVTYFFTYLVFKKGRLKDSINETAYKLTKGALIFLCLSSLGPFLLGPLVAMGYKNSSLYQDAIYFYLHFQMNGFMFLSSLGLLVMALPAKPLSKSMATWLDIFIYSTIPLYFIFTLWDKPNEPVRLLAFLGAGLNLLSWFVLCFKFRNVFGQFSFLVKAAIVAATLKITFQFLVCFPSIGDWTFLNRNLIIGYIHLLTLGIIMPVIIDQFIKKRYLISDIILAIINAAYIFSVITYLSLLFIQPLLALFAMAIPRYQFILFLLSILFLPIGFLLFFKAKRHIDAKV